jgi:hypothetical protein
MRCSKQRFIRSPRRQQHRRNGEAERPRGPQVDHKIELGGLRHRQIDWLIALQDVCCVEAHLTIRVRQAGPVAHQAAGFDVRARAL